MRRILESDCLYPDGKFMLEMAMYDGMTSKEIEYFLQVTMMSR